MVLACWLKRRMGLGFSDRWSQCCPAGGGIHQDDAAPRQRGVHPLVRCMGTVTREGYTHGKSLDPTVPSECYSMYRVVALCRCLSAFPCWEEPGKPLRLMVWLLPSHLDRAEPITPPPPRPAVPFAWTQIPPKKLTPSSKTLGGRVSGHTARPLPLPKS